AEPGPPPWQRVHPVSPLVRGWLAVVAVAFVYGQNTLSSFFGEEEAYPGEDFVAGGSLLLIPLACSLFGISSDIAMQVVAVGFIIGVLQDSCETALNSSTDVLFTAAACVAAEESTGDSAAELG
ncbi:MAG: hypothetical protein RR903_02660, partial [Edwardsiella sp. (in: enterobacteria)]